MYKSCVVGIYTLALLAWSSVQSVLLRECRPYLFKLLLAQSSASGVEKLLCQGKAAVKSADSGDSGEAERRGGGQLVLYLYSLTDSDSNTSCIISRHNYWMLRDFSLVLVSPHSRH
jgi:hypothetical protein